VFLSLVGRVSLGAVEHQDPAMILLFSKKRIGAQEAA
jgi:hypothetical protein